jgi:hypothetical protein
VPISQAVVGWLLLLAAALVFAGGVGSRALIGRRRDADPVRRVVGGFRRSGVARVLFGPVRGDALDDDELDQMILMPAIVVACGLCLTAIFLLGYRVLT